MKKDLSSLFSLFGILLGLVAIDFLIKFWVNSNVFEPIVVWKNSIGIDFFIQYVTNRGAAWGMLASLYKPLLIVRVLVIIGLLAYLLNEAPPFKKGLYLVLILAGAIGNVLDSFLYGYVIDMFHFVFWGRSYGIFNFADAMIFIGSLGLIFMPKKLVHAN